MLKGVVFDLDHTLFDRYGTLKKTVPFFFERFRMSDSVTQEKFYETLCFADKNFTHLGWDKVLSYLTSEGVFEEVPTLKEYSEFLLGQFGMIAVPFPFTVSMLRQIRRMGLKTGIITNGNVELQSKKIRLLSLENEVDEILITGSINVHKPSKEPFLVMAQRLSLEPSELLYVGDNPLNDVEGSRNAGYTPVFVNTMGTWLFPEVERAELQVETVEEIPDLIEKHFKLQ